MRRRIAVYGVTPEVLRILQALAGRPDLELVAAFAPDARELRRRLAVLDPGCAASLQRALTDDPLELERDLALDAVIDSGIAPPFPERLPRLAASGLQVLSPGEARALWLAGESAAPDAAPAPEPDRSPRDELPDALAEIAESAELAGDPDALCARLLEAALAATGATRGSLLTVTGSRELEVRAAVGLEPALWPAARRPLGEGVAGCVAASGRALVLRGPLDPAAFASQCERFDVACALVAPLQDEETRVGVLCLHHPTRADLFDDGDLGFAEALGRPAGRLVRGALAAEAERRRSACGRAARETRNVLTRTEPMPARLAALCRLAAERAGGGSAALWLRPSEGAAELRLAASSHAGGAFAGEARLSPGEGLDGRAVRDGTPLVLRRDGALAYAALPVATRGVLAVQAGERTPEIDPAPVLEAIAETAGRELDRIERDERARARIDRSQALHELALDLLELRDARAIARRVAASSALALDAAHAIVRLRAGARFSVGAWCGSAPESQRSALLALDRRAAREALRRGAPVGERELGASEGVVLLAVPLRGRGERLGTLAVYDRRSPGIFGATGFDADERDWLARCARYAGHAIERAAQPEAPRPPEAGALEPLASPLAAALALGRPFAVVSVWIDDAPDPRAVEGALRLADEGVRAHIGEQGVAVETGRRVVALIPAPDASSEGEPLARLARAVAEHVSKHQASGARPTLVFGYARHPEDGRDAGTLLAGAARPRIRML